MTAIGQGDWVQALRSSKTGRIREGEVYRVSKVFSCIPEAGYCKRCLNSETALHVQPAKNDPGGFCPCRFWPLGAGGSKAEARAKAKALAPTLAHHV